MIRRVLLVLMILLCSGLSAWSQASPPTAYQPQMISYNGVPFGKCDIYQFAINTTNGNYYSCQNHVWTSIGNGSSSDPLDCSIYSGGDLGAKWNACIAAAPAGSAISLAKFTSPQTLSTAVNINKALTVYCGGLVINQTAAVTLGATGAGIFGGAGEVCTFQKAASLAQQIIYSAGQGVVAYVKLDGKRSSGYTGSGVTFAGQYASSFVSSHVTGENSNCFTDNSSTNTVWLTKTQCDDYGASGYVNAGGINVNLNPAYIFDSGDATGPAITMTSVSFPSTNIIISDQSFVQTTSSHSTITTSGAAAINIMQSFIANTAGFAAYDNGGNGGTLFAIGSTISGGGASAVGIKHTGTGQIFLQGNTLSFTAGNDGILADSNQTTNISNNPYIQFDVTNQTGKAAIHIQPDAIGAQINNNGIAFGGVPTGDVYGVLLTTNNVNHTLSNYVLNNVITGTGNLHNVGVRYSNDGPAGTSFGNYNEITGNQCVDCGTAISRNDPGNHASNIYTDNLAIATNNLFDAGGSTLDQVYQRKGGLPFASLPIVGNGSQIYCTDCSSATAGGGTGLLLTYVNGAWTFATSQWAQFSPGTNSTAGTFAMSGNNIDFHAAAHTLAFASGTVVGKPATCTIGELYFATDATAGQNIYECQSTNVWTQQLNSGAAGASTSLGNLAAVAINASLVPAAANTVAVGSAALPVTNIFLGTVANKAGSFDSSALTTNRTTKIPDAATILPQAIAAVSHNFLTALSSTTGAFTAAQPTLADIAAGTAPSGTFDFSGVTLFKGRVGAGLTTSANGDFGYDTTNKNWHFWTNAADKVAAIWSATPTTGNCTQSSVAASVVLLADAGAPCGTWTNSSTSIGTNKTVDQEGSGNVITTVATGWLRAAGCNNATPAPSFDLPTTNQPTPNCLTGSNVTKATLDYDDAVNESAQFDIGLPHTWVGTIDINLKWLVTAAGGSNAVKWTVATACSADAATYDTAFNAAQTITTNVAANNIQTVSSQTSLTTTGCAVDNVLNVKIGRDTTDTFTGTARLIAAQLIYRHTGK